MYPTCQSYERQPVDSAHIERLTNNLKLMCKSMMTADPAIPLNSETILDSDGASHILSEMKFLANPTEQPVPPTITQMLHDLSHEIGAINHAVNHRLGAVNVIASNLVKSYHDAQVLLQAKHIHDQERRERVRDNIHEMPPIIQIDPMHATGGECIKFVLQDSVNAITDNYHCIKKNNIPGICQLIISLCEEWKTNVVHSAWKCMQSLNVLQSLEGKNCDWVKYLLRDMSVLETRPRRIIHDVSCACNKLLAKKNYRGITANKTLTRYILNDVNGMGETSLRDLLKRLCIKGCCKPPSFI